jgi:hypothetical protein
LPILANTDMVSRADFDTESRGLDALQGIVSSVLAKPELNPFHLACQLRTYYGIFPQCLAAIIAREPMKESRMPLLVNLWEEYGQGKPIKSHRVLYDNFLTSLHNASGQQREGNKDTVATAVSTENIFQCAMGAEMPTAIGMMLGLESRAPLQMKSLRTYFQSVSAGLDLEFFDMHAVDDVVHRDQLMDVALAEIKVPADLALVKKGLHTVIENDTAFWAGIAKG